MVSLTNPQASPLLALPAEVRQIILRHVFRGSFVSIVERYQPLGAAVAPESEYKIATSISADFALNTTQACQQLRTEAFPIAATSVELRVRGVTLKLLGAVVPQDFLRQVTTVKVDGQCLKRWFVHWRPEVIPKILSNLQIFYIHITGSWAWLREKDDKDLLEAAREPRVVQDRFIAHWTAPNDTSFFHKGDVLDQLQYPGVAQSIRVEIQIREERQFSPPYLIIHFGWPSQHLISCVMDDLYTFGHDRHHLRPSTVKQDLTSRQR